MGGLIVDQQAALLAENCLNRGEGKCTYGTGAFLLYNLGDTAARFDNGLTTSIAWTLRGNTSYCFDGQVYTAASAIRWVQELGLVNSPQEMDAMIADDSKGVLCGPSFAGLAAPWWKPEAGAFLTGMHLSTGKPEIFRAIMEGLASQVAHLSRLVLEELGMESGPLRVDGGLTNSKVLMQIQANLLQANIDTYPSAHATALGAAAAMRLALNPDMAVEDGPYAWEPEAHYEPAISAEEAAEFNARWVAAVEANMEF